MLMRFGICDEMILLRMSLSSLISYHCEYGPLFWTYIICAESDSIGSHDH